MKWYLGRAEDKLQRFMDLLQSRPQRIGVDVETVSLDDRTLLGVGVAFSLSESVYVAPDDEYFPRVMGLLRNRAVRKVYHNAPFDLRVLRDYGVDIDEVEDTALMARLAMEVSAVLEDVSWVLGEGKQTTSASTMLKQYRVRDFSRMEPSVVAMKCCVDAEAALGLYDYYKSRVSMRYYEGLRQMVGRLERISRQGIRLDQGRLVELEKEYSAEEQYYRALCRGMGFRVSSNFEVGYVLSERGAHLPLSKSGKQLVTDEAHLRGVNDPLVPLVLGWRDVSKKLSTYIRPMMGQERAYTTLRMEAVTGRLNSSGAGKKQPDRNLQNIPKQADVGKRLSIRGAFVPDNGVFTKADKSQLELRILAHLSGDERMQYVFANDLDIHQDTIDAMRQVGIHLTRTRAKNFNYGIGYGADEYTVAAAIGSQDVQGVRAQLQAWYRTYEGAARYFEHVEEEGLRNGYVETLGGRKIRISFEHGEKHARNCCRNYPIQGSAAEDMFLLMQHPEVDKYLGITRLQVHDELIFDGEVWLPGTEPNVQASMKEGKRVYSIRGELARLMGFYAPLDVEYAERWG